MKKMFKVVKGIAEQTKDFNQLKPHAATREQLAKLAKHFNQGK